MDEETKKFLYDDDDHQDMIRHTSSDKNINNSQRHTGVSDMLIQSNSNLDKSPIFKYKGGTTNMADLSPFGGQRRTYI